MAKTCFQINKEHDFLYRGQAYTPPAPSYLSFLTCTKGARQNSTAYSLNDTVALVPNGKTRLQLYKVTTAGTTASSLPGGFVGATAEAITDGTAVLTEQSTALLNTSTSGIPASAVEPSGGSYARVAMTNSLAGMNSTNGTTGSASSGTSGNVSNAAQLTWPSPTGNWAASPVGIWAVGRFNASAVAAGDLLEICPDTVVRNVASGDQAPIVAAAALVFNAT